MPSDMPNAGRAGHNANIMKRHVVWMCLYVCVVWIVYYTRAFDVWCVYLYTNAKVWERERGDSYHTKSCPLHEWNDFKDHCRIPGSSSPPAPIHLPITISLSLYLSLLPLAARFALVCAKLWIGHTAHTAWSGTHTLTQTTSCHSPQNVRASINFRSHMGRARPTFCRCVSLCVCVCAVWLSCTAHTSTLYNWNHCQLLQMSSCANARRRWRRRRTDRRLQRRRRQRVTPRRLTTRRDSRRDRWVRRNRFLCVCSAEVRTMNERVVLLKST